MDDKWHIIVETRDFYKVLIDPPRDVDKKYDDLMLRVTGNMSHEDMLEIAGIICDKLNN